MSTPKQPDASDHKTPHVEFSSATAVSRGNSERANGEKEPEALHAAEVPGKPTRTRRRSTPSGAGR